MLWPFSLVRKPRLTPRGTIEAIYGMIVTQAREPRFYLELGVPDTVNGRFDLLLLHLWLLLRRLRTVPDGPDLSQALFDRFCEDLDDNLREMGTGDQVVPKRMREFGEAFYGRSQAYDQAFAAGDEALAAAIDKNVLNGADLAQGRRLAAYALAVETVLAGTDEGALRAGQVAFPTPVQAEVSP